VQGGESERGRVREGEERCGGLLKLGPGNIVEVIHYFSYRVAKADRVP